MAKINSNKIWLFLVLAWGFMVFHYGWIPYNQEKYQEYDLHHYKNMAQSWSGIQLEESKPFAYRILGPWLAGMFKPNIDLGFKIFNSLFSLLSVLLLYKFLCLNGLNRSVSGWSTFLFMGNVHFFGFSSWDYFQLCDTMAAVFILLLWLFFQRKKYLLFGAALIAGLLAKETVMVFVPIIIFDFLIKNSFKFKNAGFIFACLPGLIMFFVLRNGLPTVGGAGLVEAFLKYWPKIFFSETWYRLCFNSIVPFSLIPLIFYKDTLIFIRQNKSMAIFVLLVFTSCFLGSNNERILAPISPIFYLLIGIIGQKYFSHKILVITGLTAFVLSIHHNVSIVPTDIKMITLVLTWLGALAVGYFGFISLKASLKGKGPFEGGLNLQNE